MGGGISDISSNNLMYLYDVDERKRGYILGDYFNKEISAKNSYGNYHVKNNTYYLSKCIIVRNNLIYLIDGKKTITIIHRNLKIVHISYNDEDKKFNQIMGNEIFGQKINVVDESFNKMLNDPEYIEFYKKIMYVMLFRKILLKNRFTCGICIKNKSNIQLDCGHYIYCKECFDTMGKNDDYICYLCLKNCKIIRSPVIIEGQ